MNDFLFCLAAELHSPQAWGHQQGHHIQHVLRERLTSAHSMSRVRISLAGLVCADVSFCRTAIIELASSSRRYGFGLIHATNTDLLENWAAACLTARFPILALEGESWKARGSWQLLGPQPHVGLQPMYRYLQLVSVAKTSEAATALGLKTANASNKLHQLWQDGYLLRLEQSAPSGGVEYEYALPI